MRLSYKPFCFLGLAWMIGSAAQAQDVGYSQFYDQPLLRNPALAGVFTGDVRLVGAFRNQWQNVTVPYRTFALSAEVKFPVGFFEGDYFTAGLEIMKDAAGTSEFSTTQILPAIIYHKLLSPASNGYMSFGAMGGLLQQRFDPSKLVLDDQFVAGSNGSFSLLPSSGQVFTNTSVNCFDMSLGMSYSGAWGDEIDYFAGVGLFHVNQPKVGFYKGDTIVLNKKLTFNAGVAIATSETDQLTIYGDYFKQKGVSTLQAGLLFRRNLVVVDDDVTSFAFGVLYRWNDAVIPVVQMELSKFVVGVSYDVNVSKLVVASQYRGGVEFTLTYKDFLNSRSKALRWLKCPRFGGHMPNERFNGY